MFFTIIAGVACKVFNWIGSFRFTNWVFFADSHRRLFHIPVMVLLYEWLKTVFDRTVLKLWYYSWIWLSSVLYFFMWMNLTNSFEAYSVDFKEMSRIFWVIFSPSKDGDYTHIFERLASPKQFRISKHNVKVVCNTLVFSIVVLVIRRWR